MSWLLNILAACFFRPLWKLLLCFLRLRFPEFMPSSPDISEAFCLGFCISMLVLSMSSEDFLCTGRWIVDGSNAPILNCWLCGWTMSSSCVELWCSCVSTVAESSNNVRGVHILLPWLIDVLRSLLNLHDMRLAVVLETYHDENQAIPKPKRNVLGYWWIASALLSKI